MRRFQGSNKECWKYIKEFNQAPGWAKSRIGKYPPVGYIEMLFNLKEDICEQTNLATENLDKLAELRKEYELWRKQAIDRHKHHKITKIDQYGDGDFPNIK